MCGMSQQQPDRSSPVAGAAPRRPDASMSLLTNVMEHSLDDGYAEAAARRGQVGTSRLPTALGGRLWLAAGLVLAAIVVTLGAAQAHRSAPTQAAERQRLIDRIQSETKSADRLQQDVDSLRDTVSAEQQAALRHRGGDADALLELLAAATPVEGPGVRLVVDDAREASQGDTGGPRESSGFSDTGRVRDRDMQRVVNGLWASGAEAVTVNGQRLTALSAIRAAGDAILVDNKPLAPPYTVLAIGDGKRLSKAFQESADGQYLHVLQENYGIRASVSVQDKLQLAAAPSLIVRYAKPAAAQHVPDGARRAAGAGNGKGSK
ncbi:DUF881 domain-containing protein [Actinacidiphila sp. ITFR-21]|uniref:DUF881 domain-containing protein n=1 Tax=Actinacidiphila sp. ITFR-21 TaxID=3075199 RepID=UPI0028890516|nr:DUF881 domain-containing protein [Streptomyces sp. ITFR-21]WNI19337.1 DUF881 domain-containing protein [Streptomyces sp. ITFR-21]